MSAVGRLQDEVERLEQEVERLEAKLAAVRREVVVAAGPGVFPSVRADALGTAIAIIDAPRPWGPHDPARPW